MRFRFTLTHRGSESAPFAVPALNTWDTETGADVEWSLGPAPNVTVVGTGPFTTESSEYLWVNYGFEAGVIYSITLAYTATYLSGSSNPRLAYLRILDNSFATVFTESDSTPISPGGTGSLTISFTADSSCDKIAFKVQQASEVTFVVNSVSGTSVDPNDVTLTQEINEPDGWKESILKLERDKDYRSLVEFFEGSFIFYGDNGVVNGGIEFIKALELVYGPDVSIEMLIELTEDDYTWDQVFLGQLDLSLAEELMDNKFRIPIIRDNFWAKFMNRKDTPVDLNASTDLDLAAITDPVDSIELILPSQIVTYYTEAHANYGLTYPPSVGPDPQPALLINFDNILNDDIPLFTIARAPATNEVAKILGLFEAPYNGEYIIEIKLPVGLWDETSFPGEWSGPGLVRLRLNKTNSEAVDIYDYTDGDGFALSDGADNIGVFHLTLTYSLFKGEQLAIRLHRSDVGDAVTVFGEIRLVWHTDVQLATTQAITLSGEQTIDGVMTSTDRVLVKNQGNWEENGIYVTGAGAWTRATDMDSGDEAYLAAVYITAGDNQSDSSWYQTEDIADIGIGPQIWTITDNSDEHINALPLSIFEDDRFGNFIKITAKTKFRQTQQPASLMHDAGAAILKSYGLGETNPFYSEVMGSEFTLARQYEQNGCIWKHAVLRGLQLRGYTLAEKPFFTSFNEWWKGCNPIFNLGLTYEFREGYTVTPIGSEVAALADWEDALGSNPGAWTYTSPNVPHTSVNGDAGVEGYTKGAVATVAGQTYAFSYVLHIADTGVEDPLIVVTVAILDAFDNEIVTIELNHITAGYKFETFTLTPLSDGTSVAMRLLNNTVMETKTFVLRLFTGAACEQFLLDPEFLTGSPWTHDAAGTPWVITGGAATLSLASGDSERLIQSFAGGGIGDYLIVYQRTTTNFAVSVDSMNLAISCYDEDDNLISGLGAFIVVDTSIESTAAFTSVVPVATIKIIAEVNSGADMDISLGFVELYGPTLITPIVVQDENVIRVEEVEHFYDPDFVLEISNIRNITRSYDNDKIFNKINIGYTTWKSEDISGIDDPQTQHIYSTRFEKIGTTLTLWSDWIAASLAIETTRRKTIAESTDFKFDDSVFIVAINTDDVSPDVYRPELDENFTDVQNLLDPETRYNLSLTPTRNLLRWSKWLNGCLQNYLSSYYKFVRGEGNFDMISEMIEESPDCLDQDYGGEPLSEKQDVEVTDDIIHLPNYYDIEIPLTWQDYKTIRENRKKAIGISMTDENHVALFIDELEYNIMHARVKITGWTNVFLELSVIEDDVADQLCMIPEGECANPITDENDVVLTDENGVCIEFA